MQGSRKLQNRVGVNKHTVMNGIRFSKRELTAILNIANGMAEIDGKTDSIELEVIYTQMTRFGIEYEELLSLTENAIINMDPHIAMNIISEMTLVQKQYVQALLIIIMASDGEIHEREMTMLQMLTMMCGLPPINMKDVRNTLQTFRNRAL